MDDILNKKKILENELEMNNKINENKINKKMLIYEKNVHIDCINRLHDTIEFISKEKYKALTSISLLNFAVYLMKELDDVDQSLRILLDETINTKRLITPYKDYIFVHEIFPNDISRVNKESYNYFFLTRVHNYSDFINKTNSQIQDIINKLSEKTNIKVDIVKIIMNLWDLQFDNICKLDDIHNNLDIFKYIWYDVINLDIVNKVSASIVLEKNGRYFVIGTGFTEDVIKKEIDFTNLFFIFFINLFIIFLIYFIQNQYISSNFYIFLYFLFCIISSLFMLYSFKPAGSYDREIEEKKILNNINIGIAATSFSLIFSSIYLYFSNKTIKNVYVRSILISLTIVIIALMVQPFDKNGENVSNLKKIQLYILNISLYFIIFAIIMFLNNVNLFSKSKSR